MLFGTTLESTLSLECRSPPLAVFTDQAAVDSVVTAGSILIDRDVRVAITLGVPQALG